MTQADNQLPAISDLNPDNAPAIYGHNKLDAFFDRVAQEVRGEAPDLTTKKGRDRIASQSAKVSRSKTAVEKPGRDYLKRIKELPKTIETELREFVQKMDSLRDEVREPLTRWEEAENDRVNKHQSNLEWFKFGAEEIQLMDAQALQAKIESIQSSVVDQSWQEFEAEAHRTKAAALESLQKALDARIKHDEEMAELARLRAAEAAKEQKDREDRIAREAAEAAKKEAEQKAEAERNAAIKREADAKAAADLRERKLQEEAEAAKQAVIQAEANRIAAEKKAESDRLAAIESEKQAVENARLAEIKRQADQKAAEEADTARREADKAHKGKINRAALEAFIAGGMTEDCAKLAVTLIAKGAIAGVKISY